MPTRVLRVRLDTDSAQAVTALAEAWGQSVSAVLRASVRYTLDHPETPPKVFGSHLLSGADNRSPEQAINWERDRETLMHVDLTTLLAINGPA